MRIILVLRVAAVVHFFLIIEDQQIFAGQPLVLHLIVPELDLLNEDRLRLHVRILVYRSS